MKIKKLPNSKRVVVEFEEVHLPGAADLTADAIAALNAVARRTAYNMWEFKTLTAAEQYMFMAKLKS